MVKTNYTDEEVKQILESLFIEKRRVKEIQKTLSSIDAEKKRLEEELKNQKKLSAISEKNEAIQTNQEDIHRLKNLVEYYQKKYGNQTSKEEEVDWKGEHDRLIAQMDALKAKKLTSDEQMESYRKKLADLSVIYEDVEIDKERALKTVEEYSHQIEQLRNELAASLEHIQEITHQKNTGEHTEKRFEQFLKSAQQDLSFTKGELDRVKDQFQIAQEKLSESLGINKALKLENSDLQHKLEAANQKRLSYEKQLHDLSSKYKELELQQKHRQETLGTNLKDRENRIAELQDFEKGYKKLNDQKKELENLLESERKHIHSLIQEKEESTRQLSTSKLRAEQLEKGIQYLRSKLDEANTDKNLLGEELLVNQDQVSSLTEQLKNLEEKYALQTQEKDEIHQELEAIQMQFSHLKKRIEEQEKSILEKEKQLQLLNDECSAHQESIKDHQAKLQQRNLHLEKLSAELNRVKEELLKGLEDFKEIEKSYIAALDEKQSILNGLKDHRHTLEYQQEEIQRLQISENTLQEQLRQNDYLIADLKKQIDYSKVVELEKGQFAGKCTDLEQERYELHKQIEEYSKDKIEIESRLLKCNEQIAILTEENQLLQENHQKMNKLNQEQDKEILEKEEKIKDLQIESYSNLQSINEYQSKLQERNNYLEIVSEELKTVTTQLQKNREDFKELEKLYLAALDDKQSILNGIQDHQKILESKQEEINHLQENETALREQVDQLSQHISELNLKIEQYSYADSEKDQILEGKSSQINLLNQENQHLQENQLKLQSQNEEQEKAILEKNELLERLKTESINQQDTIKDCHLKLQERSEYLETLSADLEKVKAEVQRGCEDLKEIENLYLGTLDEKLSILNGLQDHQRTIKSQKEEIHKLQEAKIAMQEQLRKNDYLIIDFTKQIERSKIIENEKNKYVEKCTGLEQKLQRLHKQLEDHAKEKIEMESRLSKCKDQLKDKDQTLESKTDQIQLLNQENHRLQELQERLQSKNEEQENQTLQAQRHLAKKVKEHAILSEKLEEYQEQFANLLEQHDQAQQQLLVLNKSLDESKHTEKSLQDTINSNLRETEAQAAQWEEKYQNISNQMQMLELQNKELLDISERYQQMRSLFNNFGSFLSNPNQTPLDAAFQETPPQQAVVSPHPAPQAAVSEESKPKPSEHESPKDDPTVNSQKPSDLFEHNASPYKSRQSLFDDF